MIIVTKPFERITSDFSHTFHIPSTMKTKLLIALIVLLLGLIVLSLFVMRGTSEPTAQPPVTGGDTQFPGPQDIVPLPDDDTSVSDSGIQDRFANFLTDPNAVSSYTTITFGGRPISLDRFMSAMDAEINPQLNELLDQGMWQLYRCPFSEGAAVEKIVLSTRLKTTVAISTRIRSGTYGIGSGALSVTSIRFSSPRKRGLNWPRRSR